MLRTTLMWLAAAALAAEASAQGSNRIIQHNPNLRLGEHYTVEEELYVTILLGVQAETFEFEAVREEGGQYVGPGEIRWMRANANAGPVRITVVGHDGHDFGAANVGTIDLSAAGVDSTIGALTISEDLGALGPIIADTLGGALTVERHILDDITLATLAGDISCDSPADLTVTGGTSCQPDKKPLLVCQKVLTTIPLSRVIT